MTFEFEKQTPAGAMEFKSFIYTNKSEMMDKEPAKILFVETGCFYNKHIRIMEMTLLFANTDFDNPLMNFTLIGEPKTIEYVDFGFGKTQIKFKHKHKESYYFLRSLLIADGLMKKNSNEYILNEVSDLKKYLEHKEIILDGCALKDGHLIVDSVV